MKVALLATAVALVAGSADPIVVTRDSLDLPAGCSPREVATRITTLLDAWERGDARALDRLLAPAGRQAPGFRWFTTQDVKVFARRGAPATLAANPRSYRLVAVDVGRSWVRGGVGFGLKLWDDGVVHGKGELHCPSGRFYVWSTTGREPGAEPEGPIVAESRSGVRPSAQEISPDYRLGTTRLALPPRCRRAPVQRRVLTMLRAFNVGAGDVFARGFGRRHNFTAYDADVDDAAGFARQSYSAGEGWTATALLPPSGTAGLPAEAVYGLTFSHGFGAKIVVDCRSGRLTRWIGPAARPAG